MKNWTDVLIDKITSAESRLPEDDWEIMSAMVNHHLHKKTLKRSIVLALLFVQLVAIIIFIPSVSDRTVPELEEQDSMTEEVLAEAAKNLDTVELIDLKLPVQRIAKDHELDLNREKQQNLPFEQEPLLEQDKKDEMEEKEEGLEHVHSMGQVLEIETQAYEEGRSFKKQPLSLTLSASFISSQQEFGIPDINKGSEDPGQVIIDPKNYYYGEHQPPITIGISLSYPLSLKWFLTSGVDYSFCRSRIVLSDGRTVGQKAHYLGGPVHIDYMPVKTNSLSLYAGTGIEAWNCVYAKQEEDRIKDGNIYFSALCLMGLRYEPFRNVAIFLEPQYSITLRRDIPTVHSSITDSRNLFMFKAGVNLSL